MRLEPESSRRIPSSAAGCATLYVLPSPSRIPQDLFSVI
jgi:hypothetical protein